MVTNDKLTGLKDIVEVSGPLIKRFECVLAFYVKPYIQAQIYTYIKKS